MKAIYQQVEQNGPPVPELLEYRLMAEFGWTQRDIDRADIARVGRAISANSFYEVLTKSRGGVGKLSEEETALLGRVMAAGLGVEFGD